MEAKTCHFIFLSPERFGDAFEFQSGRITLGRAPSADISFDPLTDLTVAPHHAEVLTDGDHFYLYNLSTRAGTLVNGHPVEERCRLEHNDVIQLGENGPELLFRIGALPEDPLTDLPRLIPQAEIRFLTGANAGEVFLIRGDKPTRIGRRADMEIALHPSANIEVSGHHCTIIHNGKHFCVVDTSRNGTYVDGVKVDKQAPLEDGSKLQLAPGGPIAEFHVIRPQRQYLRTPVSSPAITPSPPQSSPLPQSLGVSEETSSTRDHTKSSTVTKESQVINIQPVTDLDSGLQPRRRLKRKGKQSTSRRRWFRWLVVGCSLIVVIVLFVSAWRSWGTLRGASSSAIREYLSQIDRGVMMTNELHRYGVLIPRGWTKLEKDEIISLESSDKVIAVDYVSSVGLNEDSVQEILRARGAVPIKVGETPTQNGTVATFLGRGANKAWLAALHRFLGGELPLLALMEVDLDHFSRLPDEVFLALAYEKLTPPQSTVEDQMASLPASSDSDRTTTAGTKKADHVVVHHTPLAATAATPDPPQPTPGMVGGKVADALSTTCAKARLALRVSDGWTANVNETSGLLFAISPRGLEIRIARDDAALDAPTVFSQMQQDGWTSLRMDTQGVQMSPTSFLREALMQQQDLYAYLGLVEDVDSSTLVIYAQKHNVFSEVELADIRECVRRLVSIAEP